MKLLIGLDFFYFHDEKREVTEELKKEESSVCV